MLLRHLIAACTDVAKHKHLLFPFFVGGGGLVSGFLEPSKTYYEANLVCWSRQRFIKLSKEGEGWPHAQAVVYVCVCVRALTPKTEQ